VVGSVFGILTLSQKASGDSHCVGMYCDATGLSSQNDAHTSATISTIAFGVGLAAIAVDVVVILTAPKRATNAMLKLGPATMSANGGSALSVVF
jgi:hypothetical protein